MGNRRFFVSPSVWGQEEIPITGPDVKHIVKVLRLGIGDVLELLDGQGNGMVARIQKIEKEQVLCLCEHSFSPQGQPSLRVTLLQGLAKGEKMEYIIQKATELGVSQVIPLSCHRAVVRLDESKKVAKGQRWQRIAFEAAKQCRRPDVPLVQQPVDFQKAMAALPEDALCLLLWEGEKKQGLKEILLATTAPQEVYVVVGPEGGFTEEEVAWSLAQGALPVSLGPRILRTETAGPACLAILMHCWGDLG